jgi:glycerol transport system ATP-binding protein
MVCCAAMLTLKNLRLTPLADELPLLEFAPGQIHVVLGRNRSGKTALCRLLAGLPSAASAQIQMGDQDWTDLAPRARSVALVYQAFINYPHWSVARNIGSPLVAQGLAASQVTSVVGELAERLQLTPLLERLPHELSGGQQQRVAIGRALAKGSQLLLLDEPLVNLDYKLREALEIELLDLLKSSGATVLYTSSDPKDALGLADNLILLEDHRVVQQGAPLSLYQEPNSAIAADLLSDPGVNRLPTPNGIRYVRPEHLLLREQLADPGQSGMRHFAMQVTALETNGSHSYVHGQVEGKPWIAKLDGLPNLSPNSNVELTTREADLLSLPGG